MAERFIQLFTEIYKTFCRFCPCTVDCAIYTIIVVPG